MTLFSNPQRNAAYAARALLLGAMMGFWFYSTLFMQKLLGFSALQAGLAFLPLTLSNFIAALLVGRLTDRESQRRALITAFALATIGMGWLATLSSTASYLGNLLGPFVLIGLGQGGILSPLTLAALRDVNPAHSGAASGVVHTAHQLGGSVGLASMALVFAHSGSSPVITPILIADKIAHCLLVGTVLLLVATLLVYRQVAPSPNA